MPGALTRRNNDVTNLTLFKATSLYVKVVGRMYVVFSYRDSWPIYIHHPHHGWFVNSDKPYSLTTARHMSCAYPDTDTLQPMTLQNMLGWIEEAQQLDYA